MATPIRPHFDTGEKRFLFACVLLTGAFLGTLLWWGAHNELPELETPAPAPLAINAFDDFTNAAVLVIAAPRNPPLDPMFERRGKSVPRKDWPKVYPLWRKKAWISQNAPALKALREGLPHPYQFPRDFKFYLRYPHYADFYHLSTALKVESDVRAAKGDWKGAAQSALDNIQFGFKNGHTGAYTGVRQLKSLQTHLDAASCRSAAHKIFQWQAQQRPYWEKVQDEKWFLQTMLLDTLCQRDWATRLATFNGGSAPTDWWSLMPVRLQGRRRVFDDFTRVMDARIEAARKPYAKATAVLVPDGIIGQWLFQIQPTGDVGIAHFYHVSAETRTALLMVALALRAYRLENGAYPTTLSELTPNYLPQIPADPFGGGEALRYKKRGDSFVLWSIGPDKKDDGGKPILRTLRPDESRREVFGDEAENEVELPSQGDWVYGKNR